MRQSQLDKAIADLDGKIAAATTEREQADAARIMKIAALMDCREALLATKQATAKLKGAAKRKPKEQAPGQ